MMLAFDVAVSAASPRYRPTQTELIEALSDCRMLLPSTGSENISSVRPIGPVVSLASGFIGTGFSAPQQCEGCERVSLVPGWAPCQPPCT